MGSTRSDIEIIEQSLNEHNIGGKVGYLSVCLSEPYLFYLYKI